ncbi:uncharacterized protein FOMMEDRAFT_106123 [Fomitiporia mediterranea MF3/22]|uniref:uncharacterized protein n=1 Tax=Fomitiporia mediterranea (strain MF3/22) TaxID=694068 RepID=UPI00044086AB|nr:uncharacterized protein FOMMEDRAFT_106123 [Fomitiporia mediterranea MF3/22]EJD03868.1 hypothetical protein FOMMEDRAFT_106123 [Fomitiporia mediterranea MF3/22]
MQPYFFENVYQQALPSQSQTLADKPTVPPVGFMHDPYQNNSMRPRPPALQTQNLVKVNEHPSESPYSRPHSSIDSPCTQLSTPMTPAKSLFYMNGSAADSLTSFSPSSNTSGESASPERASPVTDNAPLDEAASSTSLTDHSGNTTERKKRNSRRMWTHSLEKYIFTPHEIATLGTPHRRTIYSASLEAHIDRLHSQLLGIDLFPVDVKDLEVYRGLNCKIAKGMVAGLQHDFVRVRTQLLEIERAMNNAREIAAMRANHERIRAQSQGQGETYGLGLSSNFSRGASHSNNQPRAHDSN